MKTAICWFTSFLLFCSLIAIARAKDSVRVVTKDELSKKDGKQSEEIWLSILGEVYDVTEGKRFYSEGGPYSIFAGRDGSVPFVTGVFTVEEADKPVSVLSQTQLNSLDTWRESYETKDMYRFIGVLEGPLYNKDGEPTEELLRIRELIKEQKVISAKKEAERQERIKQRKLKEAEADL